MPPIQETRGKVCEGPCALIEFQQEIRIEQWILIDSILRIPAWIAHYPRSIHEIVEAVVGMSVYPESRAAAVDQVFGIGDEARIQKRIGKSGMDAFARGCMVGDDHG